MNKTLFGLGLSLILLSCGWLLGLHQQLNVGTPSSRWVFDAYQHKISIARQYKEKRTLIVAGSNAMFGINSAQIEAFWNRPTINLGVNAGLGLDYIFYKAKQVARSGDVILLPMEYALYLDDGTPNAQIVDYAFARDPLYLQSLSPLNYLQFTFAMSPERWIQGLRRPIDSPVTNGTYGAHHLDQRGDQTFSSKSDRTEGGRLSVEQAKNWQYGARSIKEIGGWNMLASFSRWAKINGICLIAVPTVLLHHDQYDTDLIEKKFYDSLPNKIKTLGISFVGKPRDFMYPREWFFDTDHHLQDWARNRHTSHLIHLLNPDPLTYCH